MDKQMLADAIKGRRGQAINLKIIVEPAEEISAEHEAMESPAQEQAEEENLQGKSDLAPDLAQHPDAPQDMEMIKQMLAERPETGNSFQSKIMQKRDMRAKK